MPKCSKHCIITIITTTTTTVINLQYFQVLKMLNKPSLVIFTKPWKIVRNYYPHCVDEQAEKHGLPKITYWVYGRREIKPRTSGFIAYKWTYIWFISDHELQCQSLIMQTRERTPSMTREPPAKLFGRYVCSSIRLKNTNAYQGGGMTKPVGKISPFAW